MMKCAAFVIGVAAISVPALAQSSSTTCVNSGVFTNCHTTSNPNSQIDTTGIRNLVDAIRERKARKKSREAAEVAAAIRQGVIKLIREGNCAGAQQMALDLSGLELATQVAQYCQAAETTDR